MCPPLSRFFFPSSSRRKILKSLTSNENASNGRRNGKVGREWAAKRRVAGQTNQVKVGAICAPTSQVYSKHNSTQLAKSRVDGQWLRSTECSFYFIFHQDSKSSKEKRAARWSACLLYFALLLPLVVVCFELVTSQSNFRTLRRRLHLACCNEILAQLTNIDFA